MQINTKLTFRPHGEAVMHTTTIKETVSSDTRNDRTDYHIMLACAMRIHTNHWYMEPASEHPISPH